MTIGTKRLLLPLVGLAISIGCSSTLFSGTLALLTINGSATVA